MVERLGTHRWSVLVAVLSLLVLSGCGGKEEQIAKPEPLLKFGQILKYEGYKRSWGRAVEVSELIPWPAQRIAHDEGTLFVASGAKLLAVAADNGKKLWAETPAVDDLSIDAGFGRIFVASRTGEVVVYNPQGEQQWRTRVNGEVLTGPRSNGDVVVIHTHAGGVFAFDLIDGSERWKYSYEQPSLLVRGSSAPEFRFGALVLGRADGYISLHQADSGRLLQQFPISEAEGSNELELLSDIDGAMAFASEQMFVADYQHGVVGVSLRTGEPLWAKKGFGAPQGVVYRRNRVFMADNNGTIVALNANDGEVVWRQPRLRQQRPQRPALVGDALAVPVAEGLVLMDPQTGLIRGRMQIGGGVVTLLALEDALYVLSGDGKMYGYTIR